MDLGSESTMYVMKKRVLVILFLKILTITAYSQNICWNIFASGSCNAETFEVGEIHQNFIKVNQKGNRFYWGDSNYYTLYNKEERQSGFMSFTTYDFIDKYNQRGRFIYQNNRDEDWATRHMFYIFYEGINIGKVYLSNAPESK